MGKSYYNSNVKKAMQRRIHPMAKVTKDTMIGELLQIDSSIAPMLLEIGMHCLGCPSSQMETIAEAAMVHGIEPDALVEDINNYLENSASA
jgi:hybrid cluster-associated redox disulfide protein